MKTIVWRILCLLHQVRAIQITRDVWYVLTSHQYKELCASETQPQPDMNNTEPNPHASTNQAPDPPTRPAETTLAFIERVLQQYPFTSYLLKASGYFLGGYIVLKTFEYVTDKKIPIEDRERTVKAVCPLLLFIWKLCKWSHRFDLSPMSETSTASKTSGISNRDSTEHHNDDDDVRHRYRDTYRRQRANSESRSYYLYGSYANDRTDLISAQWAKPVPPQKPVESVTEILQNIISNKK